MDARANPVMESTAESVVVLRGLVKQFGEIKAVDGLSLQVKRGDIYGFLGPNGSGKSTSIRMMLGLIRPTGGEVLLFGQRLSDANRRLLHKVGSLIERPDFYNYLSALQNLKILAGYSGLRPTKAQLLALLQLVGLEERANSRVRTFSQGMKQRLGIAQALLHNPDLIVLDEPVNGLDPQGIRDIRDLILRLNREEGKTLIISSHILREMELIANRMVVISKGKAVAEGEVKSLVSQASNTLWLKTDKPIEAYELLVPKLGQAKVQQQSDGALVLYAPYHDAAEISLMLAAHQIGILSLIPQNSLEDYFLQVT